MKKGIFIVFEGVDSSGKETQASLVQDKLKEQGQDVLYKSFPNYESESSALIKKYLNGGYGDTAYSVNPYQASTLFITDRLDDYLSSDWSNYKEDNITVISDRYSSSNLIHQGSKIDDKEERQEFINYIDDLEHNKLNIPRPDITFFLDVPIQHTFKMNKTRLNKINNSDKKDIHESDHNYIEKSYNNAVDISKQLGWHHIKCVKDGEMRSIDDINKEIMDVINKQ